MSYFDIIITVNPKSSSKEQVERLVDHGGTILRLNGAFLEPKQIVEDCRKIRSWIQDRAKLLLDLPGYKLRLAHLESELQLQAGASVELEEDFFNYPEFMEKIKEGNILRVNDGLDGLKVVSKQPGRLVCRSERSCTLRKGKGVHLEGTSYRPSKNSLSSHDLALIEASRNSHVDYLGLSFVYNLEDIAYVEGLTQGSPLLCIPKIEAKESLDSHFEIMKHHKLVIVDRGDLAGEIGIQNIWQAQRTILSTSRLLKSRVILATQFLTHMVEKPLPTIAEVDSLCDLLNIGLGGIQLSEETSVGLYPERAVAFVKEMSLRAEESRSHLEKRS